MRKIAAAALALGLAGPAAAQDWVAFRSPTGNIHCLIFADAVWQGARCDILRLDRQSFARPPADCEFDWGHAFEVPRNGAAGPICASDSLADPGAPVLGYGRSVSAGGVTCTSEKTGMTCVNREGHGFTLSRAAQRVF